MTSLAGVPWRHRSLSRAIALAAFAIPLLGCGGGDPEVAVVMTDFSFNPSPVPVQAGRRTIITLENKGTTEHNFSVPQLNVVSTNIAPGGKGRVEIAAPPGGYRLLCTVEGHEAAGMVAEVRVARR